MKRVLGLTIAAVLIPVASLAATYNVPGDFATIQAAITGAPAGSTIMVAAGTYFESLQATNLAKDLYLKSAGAPGSTKVDGQWARTLLRIENGGGGGDAEKNLVFDGFAFQNGIGSAVAAPVTIASAKPGFLNCTFEGNYSPISGGAVVVYGATAAPVFTNCVFLNNRAGSQGGAALVNGGHCQAIFKKCLFQGNSCATTSGATYNEGGALLFSVAGGQVIDCTFIGNTSDYTAGAIMVLTHFTEPIGDVVTIKGSTFQNNSCQPHSTGRPEPSEGGAIMAESNVTVVVRGCSFTGNAAETGGAIQSYRANLDIADSVFDGNQANGTGYAYGGAINLNTDDGADVDRREASMTIARTVVRNNTGAAAAGILFGGDGTYGKNANLTLTDVTVDANSATGSSGGGIYLNRCTCAATRVYVLRNSAALYGGGIVLVAWSNLTLTDSVVAGNTASVDPAIHNPVDQASSYTLNNTTLAYNNGAPAVTMTLLAATPALTVGGKAYLTYFAAPYNSASISPSVGALPDSGGYAAGSVAVAGLTADTVFSLSTTPLWNRVLPQATITYARDGRTDGWFKGRPLPVPGRIEAEDFDAGGRGVGYLDATPTNVGGSAYRSGESVDLYAAGGASNGTYVASVSGGEYLDYTVSVATGQAYDLQLVTAAAGADGRYYVQVDGVDVTGVRSVASTGSAQTWGGERITGINLTAGQHLIRLVIVQGEFSVDAIDWPVSTPWVALSPASLSRAAALGRTAPDHTFTVRNSGSGTMNYTVSDNAGWLSVDAVAGVSTGESDTITVHYDTAALGLGAYSAVITVASPDAPNSPQTLPVSLLVLKDLPVSDFNGDGNPDILWQETGGTLAVWYMSGAQMTGSEYLNPSWVPTSWKIVGTGDVNRDGNPDILWKETSGTLAVWYMTGAQMTGSEYLNPGWVPSNWNIMGTGDFNGDGNLDILWQDTGGTLAVWYMSGAQMTGSEYLTPGWVPWNWRIVSTGDLNGDGNADILWQETTGTLAVWYMSGAQMTGSDYLTPNWVPSNWKIVGFGGAK